MKLTRKKLRKLMLEAMKTAGVEDLTTMDDLYDEYSDEFEYEQLGRGFDAAQHSHGEWPPVHERPVTSDPNDRMSQAYNAGYQAGLRAARSRSEEL